MVPEAPVAFCAKMSLGCISNTGQRVHLLRSLVKTTSTLVVDSGVFHCCTRFKSSRVGAYKGKNS